MLLGSAFREGGVRTTLPAAKRDSELRDCVCVRKRKRVCASVYEREQERV